MFKLLNDVRKVNTKTPNADVWRLAVKALTVMEELGDTIPANTLCSKLPLFSRGSLITWFHTYGACYADMGDPARTLVFDRSKPTLLALAMSCDWFTTASRHLPVTTGRNMMSDVSFNIAVEGISSAYSKEYIQVLALTALQSTYDTGHVQLAHNLCTRLSLLDRSRILNWFAQHGNFEVLSVMKSPYLKFSDKGQHKFDEAEATPWYGRPEHRSAQDMTKVCDVLERVLEAATDDYSCGEDMCDEVLDILMPAMSGLTQFR